MSVFVHAQGIKTVHAREGGGKIWQNSIYVVVECSLKVHSFLRQVMQDLYSTKKSGTFTKPFNPTTADIS